MIHKTSHINLVCLSYLFHGPSPITPCVSITFTGESECVDNAVDGMNVRDMIGEHRGHLRTFGTIGDSLNLMREAWKDLIHSFSIRAPEILTGAVSTQGATHLAGPRYPLDTLRRHPVDLLVIECGHWQNPRAPRQGQRWEHLVAQVEASSRPKFVVEIWPPNALLWDLGPSGKSARVRWNRLGYSSHMKVVDSQHCGGALVQPRAIVLRDRTDSWDWAPYSTLAPLRPMQNLLIPKGLRPRRHHSQPTPSVETLPSSDRHPMPSKPGAWIHDLDGPRTLFLEEIAKGLGVPKDWNIDKKDYSPKLITNSTSLFHWEYLSQCFLQMSTTQTSPATKSRPLSEALPSPLPPPNADDDDDYDFPEWRPPDMSPGSPWYEARIERLQWAAGFYDDSEKLVEEGIQQLAIHRENYDETGPAPKRLQLLWWEFPQSSWDDVRLGGSMNFLSEPKHQITPNSPMNAEELQVAGEFVDELVALGVLREPTDENGMPVDVVTNAPLFTVPKPGQPGQYRCIADMLKGGQNESVGSDPVVLPRAAHIVDEMYHGGYSAVYDFSKYFYNFPTRAEDRPYLGLLHPITEAMLAYYGLPMGGGNSPGVAGRGGEAFLRLVRESSHLFQGKALINCWWTGFQIDGGYDPRYGYGYNLVNLRGLVVRLWGFVDDFMKHAPNRRLIHEARLFFMDVACILGFLCHPMKCPKPSQCVKFIGFEFDSHGFPLLRVPLEKRERALAVVEYLIASPPGQFFSRLSLAVSTGILQSLVEATPSHIGSTYLRAHYDLLHPPGGGVGLAPYCTKTIIPESVRVELSWWAAFLRSTCGRFSRMMRSATLVPNWGDGSGTGTGGTLGLPNAPLRMWQGLWSPVVYKFSSNWKELKTLDQTLLHLRDLAADDVRGTTVFYFTDNSTTYWIAQSGSSPSPRLHVLIWQIKCLELELGIQLQVVHVPGVVMIEQGSDALSRGVWVTPFHSTMDQRALTAAVFAPLSPDLSLIASYVARFNLPSEYRLQQWDCQWWASDLLDQFNVWFPPPELARQAITFMLAAWVQRPTTTSALFFVPRVIPAFWFGLCRHIVELDPVLPRQVALEQQPVLPIPIIVLYLPPHTRSLRTPSRLDKPTPPRGVKWHKAQAELLRGLPPTSLSEQARPDMCIRPPRVHSPDGGPNAPLFH